MGVFDESICDCCVCPMQCVLEQLIGIPNLAIRTRNLSSVDFSLQLIELKILLLLLIWGIFQFVIFPGFALVVQ
ncbi:hypothetical protein [Chengkuizengella marina]|uniref:Uncharacterized protein n=1 Tax=Chengkuizengella marina TaxID=2507566 RepID=A0A6N9PZK6_9BACL|nr:hypothetical protein [Chengkuizengella marina]NBI28252.1 hypothetical protein [Chengkuizengella marina]